MWEIYMKTFCISKLINKYINQCGFEVKASFMLSFPTLCSLKQIQCGKSPNGPWKLAAKSHAAVYYLCLYFAVFTFRILEWKQAFCETTSYYNLTNTWYYELQNHRNMSQVTHVQWFVLQLPHTVQHSCEKQHLTNRCSCSNGKNDIHSH